MLSWLIPPEIKLKNACALLGSDLWSEELTNTFLRKLASQPDKTIFVSIEKLFAAFKSFVKQEVKDKAKQQFIIDLVEANIFTIANTKTRSKAYLQERFADHLVMIPNQRKSRKPHYRDYFHQFWLSMGREQLRILLAAAQEKSPKLNPYYFPYFSQSMRYDPFAQFLKTLGQHSETKYHIIYSYGQIDKRNHRPHSLAIYLEKTADGKFNVFIIDASAKQAIMLRVLYLIKKILTVDNIYMSNYMIHKIPFGCDIYAFDALCLLAKTDDIFTKLGACQALQVKSHFQLAGNMAGTSPNSLELLYAIIYDKWNQTNISPEWIQLNLMPILASAKLINADKLPKELTGLLRLTQNLSPNFIDSLPSKDTPVPTQFFWQSGTKNLNKFISDHTVTVANTNYSDALYFMTRAMLQLGSDYVSNHSDEKVEHAATPRFFQSESRLTTRHLCYFVALVIVLVAVYWSLTMGQTKSDEIPVNKL